MKELFTKFRWLIIFSIISPLAIYYIVVTPSPIGFIKPEDTGAWLGYYGGIIASIIAIAGVKWSIDVQKEQLMEQQISLENRRRRDLAMQYRPILNCTSTNYSFFNNNTALCMYFSLKNIGRAEAIDVKIKAHSESPLISQLTYDHTSIIEMNNDFKFMIIFVWKGRDSDDGKSEALHLDEMYDLTNEPLKSSAEITFSDIVDTKYCLQFDIECEYLVALGASDTNGLSMFQLQELIKSTPRTWKIDLKNVRTTDLSNEKVDDLTNHNKHTS